jgi:hypothetical protein
MTTFVVPLCVHEIKDAQAFVMYFEMLLPYLKPKFAARLRYLPQKNKGGIKVACTVPMMRRGQ